MHLNNHLHSLGVGAMGHRYFQVNSASRGFIVCLYAAWLCGLWPMVTIIGHHLLFIFGFYSSGTPVC